MKILVAAEQMILQIFLEEVLRDHEGIRLERGPAGTESPDATDGWVVILGPTSDGTVVQGVRDKSWVASVAVVDIGDGGVADEILDVPRIRIPGSESEIVESLLAASTHVALPAPVDDGRERILVAEDSKIQRGFVVAALQSEGFRVIEAEDGARALEMLRGGAAVDMVVTDVEMPNMTGLELTRAIRADTRLSHLPVLVLTTLSGFDQVKAGFDAGASDYIVKPLKGEREMFLERVTSRVAELLGKNGAVSGKRALVVDDSRTTRRMVADYLTRAGYRVTTAADGQEAKELLESMPDGLPDVVVTDLEMPRMDGLRLTHHIKNTTRTRELPTIILSASKMHQHRVLGRGFGADAFISKPFSEEKLLVTVEQVLARTRLEKERRELSRILGRDVFKAIHDEGLQARKTELVILFSDIAGFSSMSSGREAAEVVELLNEYFDLLVDFILQEQGYVNKFVGDAIIALFSARPELDPPDVRAVRAAISFQLKMLEVNQAKAVPLLTRFGINKGDVILGLIGAGERKDYTVIGDHVNRAQRYEGEAPVGGVLLSRETYEGARAWLDTRPDLRVTRREDVQLKGINEPVTAYAVEAKS